MTIISSMRVNPQRLSLLFCIQINIENNIVCIYIYQTACVIFSIAQNIANANQSTKSPATKIAIGSIHLVIFARE